MKAKSINEHKSDEIRIRPNKSLPKINVPQDICRVLIYLINNIFLAAPYPPGWKHKEPHYKHKPTGGINKLNAFSQTTP